MRHVVLTNEMRHFGVFIDGGGGGRGGGGGMVSKEYTPVMKYCVHEACNYACCTPHLDVVAARVLVGRRLRSVLVEM